MSNHSGAAGLARVLAKLDGRAALSPRAKAAFMDLPNVRRSYDAHYDLMLEGSRPRVCRFLENGVVSRSKLLRSGGRQISSFHIAGDLIDLPSALLLIADHTLRTHEACDIVEVDTRHVLELAADHPELGRAFWFDTLVDASVFREWNLNIGRRTARQRTAHLLMEIGYRLELADLGDRCDYAFAITQVDLSDALALSPVHVSRSLGWLKANDLVDASRRRTVIPDWHALAAFCDFAPLYLHPEGPRHIEP